MSLIEKMNNTDSKPCKICHKIKSLKEFSNNAQIKSGISNRCKACDKKQNAKRFPRKRRTVGFSWQDITKGLLLSLEEEFDGLYGNSTIRIKGKLVIKKGKVLDEEWHQKKLLQLRKGRRD